MNTFVCEQQHRKNVKQNNRRGIDLVATEPNLCSSVVKLDEPESLSSDYRTAIKLRDREVHLNLSVWPLLLNGS